jgi:ADP-heptose:LPS heptosyltransferase
MFGAFMNYEELIKIDKLGGVPSTQGVRQLKRITDHIVKKFKSPKTESIVDILPKKPKRILVVKLWGIGNMILAGMALKSIRKAYPDAFISLLTTKDCSEVYENNRLYNDVITFPQTSLATVQEDVLKLCSSLEIRKFDLAINFEGLSEIASFITSKSGADVTVGMSSGSKGGNYTIHSPYSGKRHVEDVIYDCALAAGGAEVSPGLVKPIIKESDKDFCNTAKYNCGIDPYSLIVGININSGTFAGERRWPLEKFALLAQQIEAQQEFRTVFFGSSQEHRYVGRCISLMDTPGINLSGSMTISQMAAFLEEVHLLITNDSGLLHLAAAMEVPTVSIFGPESPDRIARRDEEKHAIIYTPQPCSPCISMLGMSKEECREGCRCVNDITVEQVTNTVMDMLDHLADPEDPPWLK